MFVPWRCLRITLLWITCTKLVEVLTSEMADPVVIQVRDKTDRMTKSTIETGSGHSINIVGDEFVLDGQPLHVVSGSIHYFRVPAVYWRDRLRKLKIAGFNAVATYVEWSFHEPEERQYSFEGDRDVAQFVKIAAEEGLYVLLRPGPYICAERDLGGFPYWLLGKYPNINLRSTDTDFINESKIWVAKLFEQISPLLYGNGGPIILVQVENEYGSFGHDMAYKLQMRDILREHVGTNAILYTTDGAWKSYFVSGAIPDTLTTIDFGVGQDSTKLFMPLREFMPKGPLMNSEYYPGWLTHWGESLQQVTTDRVVASLCNMLDNKINVNMYVFFGGTNFEFTAGANFDGTYQPDITSYDYDAPLTEAGDPTIKYYAIRDALKKYNFVNESISTPEPSPKGKYGEVVLSAKLDLLSSEGRSSFGKKYNDLNGWNLPTFESLRQRAGLVLYETILNETDGVLEISQPRDRVHVFVDGELRGIISRMQKNYQLNLKSNPGSVLSLLVENQGRINFGHQIHDYKGILLPVTHNNKMLNGKWSVTGFPLEDLNHSVTYLGNASRTPGPTLYEGHFTITEALDTFLDTTLWGKGYIWINGHNLGRYWPSTGPQVTLYVPGAWLRVAPLQNRLQILELDTPPANPTVQFIDYPILNRTKLFFDK